VNKYVPPPPPPPTPEEKQEMIDNGEIPPPPPKENNEWAEFDWLQKRKEKDPCEGRDDCVYKCVLAS